MHWESSIVVDRRDLEKVVDRGRESAKNKRLNCGECTHSLHGAIGIDLTKVSDTNDKNKMRHQQNNLKTRPMMTTNKSDARRLFTLRNEIQCVLRLIWHVNRKLFAFFLVSRLSFVLALANTFHYTEVNSRAGISRSTQLLRQRHRRFT